MTFQEYIYLCTYTNEYLVHPSIPLPVPFKDELTKIALSYLTHAHLTQPNPSIIYPLTLFSSNPGSQKPFPQPSRCNRMTNLITPTRDDGDERKSLVYTVPFPTRSLLLSTRAHDESVRDGTAWHIGCCSLGKRGMTGVCVSELDGGAVAKGS